MKVVLDSNVLVAAFATEGLCHLVYGTILVQHELLLSPIILKEVEKALQGKLKVPKAQVREIIRFLKEHSTLIEDHAPANIECRDPDDLFVVGVALLGEASTIVTGDADLLVLKQVENVSIVSPRQFWESLRNKSA